jgi:WW domain-binding protein 4
MTSYKPKATRHYCALCNSWMGNDRQSISLHENGGKHKMKVAEALQKNREDKREKEQAEREMREVMSDVNAAAYDAMGGAGGGFVAKGLYSSAAEANKARDEWAERKKRREEKERERENDEDEDGGIGSSSAVPPPPPEPEASVGYYTIKDATYLEGDAFPDLLVPDTVTVQAYIGTDEDGDWIEGLITEVSKEELSNTASSAAAAAIVLSKYTFGYLKDGDDDETEVPNLQASKFRILCGADGAPANLDEALLLRDGGVRTETIDSKSSAVDANTGFGVWDTVQVRTVTTALYEKEQKEEKKSGEKAAAAEEEMRKKEAEMRRLEMAKYSNKDDSALGSFNVWGGGGYKGVDITGERIVDGNEKVGGSGEEKKGKVAFKKRKR